MVSGARAPSDLRRRMEVEGPGGRCGKGTGGCSVLVQRVEGRWSASPLCPTELPSPTAVISEDDGGGRGTADRVATPDGWSGSPANPNRPRRLSRGCSFGGVQEHGDSPEDGLLLATFPPSGGRLGRAILSLRWSATRRATLAADQQDRASLGHLRLRSRRCALSGRGESTLEAWEGDWRLLVPRVVSRVESRCFFLSISHPSDLRPKC